MALNINEFKEKFPVLFWRENDLTETELLNNIVQLEHKEALKEFLEQVGPQKTERLLLKISNNFSTHPDLIDRYTKMFNYFVVAKLKDKNNILSTKYFVDS